MAMVLVGITAEAQLVRSATLTVTREKLPPVELGWKHIIDAQVGIKNMDDDAIGGIHYIAGYRFSQNLLAGVGIGCDFSGGGMAEGSWGTYHNLYSVENPHAALALYLHGRYFFSTDEWAPYVGASAGAYLAKKSDIYKELYGTDDLGELDWFNYLGSEFETSANSSSLYFDVNVGLNHRLSNNYNTELSVYAGLKLWAMPYYSSGNKGVTIGTTNAVNLYIGTSLSF